MSCTNCYNGCAEIVSDKCVKYTGVDVPALGIETGDSLLQIEEALISFLSDAIIGVGIKPIIDETIICEVVDKYLPDCGGCTLNDFITALIKAACDLQDQIDVIAAEVASINADYDVDCLTGVVDSSDTHDVLQAVITKLCQLDADLAALALDVSTNYVKLADLDTLIAAYLASQPSSDKYYTRMIPYTVVEYYGTLANFNATGAGLGDWEKIYLCNGLNGTPDKRGRVGVGAIQLVPGGAPGPAVNPATPGNPNYAVLTTTGANTVVLDVTQIPSHTHTATASVTDPGHTHTLGSSTNTGPTEYAKHGGGFPNNISPTNSATTGITVGVTVNATGGSLGHNNIQPVLACYYIMYIP